MQLGDANENAVHTEDERQRTRSELERAVEQQAGAGQDHRLGEQLGDPDVLADPGLQDQGAKLVGSHSPRVDQGMHELGREAQHREEQRRGQKGDGARHRLSSTGGRAKRTADDHGGGAHLDEVRRREQAVEPNAGAAERRRPEGRVDDPGGAEDQGGHEAACLALGQGPVPRASRSQAEREGRGQVERQQGPCRGQEGEPGLFGRLDDVAALVDVGVRDHVGAKHQPGAQDRDHDVDGPRLLDEASQDLHRRNPGPTIPSKIEFVRRDDQAASAILTWAATESGRSLTSANVKRSRRKPALRIAFWRRRSSVMRSRWLAPSYSMTRRACG